ncbi:MAG: ABC transporter permease [Candidatus Omnitrophica bacterium]|nr:ABC transporter permease [Candidatus Omnitrophota bacterium]
MNTIWILVKKDLLRDLKRPWGLLVLLCIPVITGWFMALAFGGGEGSESAVVIHVAVLDQDGNFIGGMMRSLGSQGDAQRNLQIHPVKTVEEGIRLLERRKASAFLVLPENLTNDLIDGVTASVQLYKNPAEAMLPKVVEQGTSLLAVGISEFMDLLGPQVKEVVDLLESGTAPSNWLLAMRFYQGLQKLDTVRDYVFPPLIRFETVAAKEYIPSASRIASGTGGAS